MQADLELLAYSEKRERLISTVEAVLSKFLTVAQGRFAHEGIGSAFASLTREIVQNLKGVITESLPDSRPQVALEHFSELVDRCINLARSAEVSALDDLVQEALLLLHDCSVLLNGYIFALNKQDGVAAAAVWRPVSDRFSAVETQIRTARQDFDVYELVYSTAAEARSALNHAKEAAGITGGTGLANHYSAHAKAERWWNVGWTTLLVLLVGASVGLAWFLVRTSSSTSFSSREVGRLALVAPLLLLGAYASRQARFHRDAAARSALIAVQLRTIVAFGDALDRVGREEMLRNFGLSLFGVQVDRVDASDPAYGLGSEVLEGLKALGRPDAAAK